MFEHLASTSNVIWKPVKGPIRDGALMEEVGH